MKSQGGTSTISSGSSGSPIVRCASRRAVHARDSNSTRGGVLSPSPVGCAVGPTLGAVLAPAWSVGAVLPAHAAATLVPQWRKGK